jgi:predicted nucleotide-binding protein (sugar kinase/HSP70/actin superfamily)
MGYDLAIRTTVSNNAYRDIGLGAGFERLAWKGVVATDNLQRLLWRVRPYEKQSGATEALFEVYLRRLAENIKKKAALGPTLKQASSEFSLLVDKGLPRRPLVGINGEIYLRSNRFSNRDLVKACERAGLEVIVSPIGEWLKYTSFRNLEDSLKWHKWDAIVKSFLRKYVQEQDERAVSRNFDLLIHEKEPSTASVLAKSSQFLSSRCGSEAVLSIGSGIEWLENPQIAGVISVMPHGCMPGGIVASMSEKFSDQYGKPWVSLTYDGFLETNNSIKINEFAELVRFCQKAQA